MKCWICPYEPDLVAEQRAELIAPLNRAEREKLSRYRRTEDRLEFLVSRYVVRRCLSELSCAHPGELRLTNLSTGQPVIVSLDGESQVASVSLSHTHGAVALLAGPRAVKCGIDVERMTDLNVKQLLTARFFSSREREWVESGSSVASIRSRFFRVWTLKEAYLKATGEGMAGFSDKVEVLPVSHEQAEVIDHRVKHETGSSWYFQTSTIGDAYFVARAWEKRPDLRSLVEETVGDFMG
ncbi:4'-phosphopantetheinyl transferase superfamily protein [Marinobacteraceae bacterium S3BR75-40.1]